MKHIELFEQWVPKLSMEPAPISKVGSFGQRITDTGKKKIKKQDMIVATDDTIRRLVRDEIDRLGKDADLNHIDVSQVTDMSYLFELTNFGGDISEWDVSKVENMNRMFCDCWNFNGDLSKWDVSNTKDMYNMFSCCYNFNSDISKWDVSRVENMMEMFRSCHKFNQDISGWDISKVKWHSYMFTECPIKEEFKPKFI